MKFWQITSIFRDDLSLLESIFRAEKQIAYLRWLAALDEIVSSQNRQILDAPLPDSLARKVLEASDLRFHVDNGFLRRTNSAHATSDELSALDVYTKYGGDAIEATLEYGSFPLPNSE